MHKAVSVDQEFLELYRKNPKKVIQRIKKARHLAFYGILMLQGSEKSYDPINKKIERMF